MSYIQKFFFITFFFYFFVIIIIRIIIINKIREATPEPSFSKLCLDKKKNIDKEKRKNQNNKIKLRLYNNNDEDNIDKIINLEEEIKEALKEKEKLEKDIENF